MAPVSLPRFAQPLVALLAVACAGAPDRPVRVADGEATRVTLLQVSDGLRFELQNASAVDRAAVYSDAAANPLAKVVPDAQLQALLDVFAAGGLFAAAAGTPAADARDVLRVDHGGQSWVWSRRRAGVQADETAFHEAKAYFLELYNSSTAYHRGQQRPEFSEERTRAEAEAVRRKLEAMQRQGR